MHTVNPRLVRGKKNDTDHKKRKKKEKETGNRYQGNRNHGQI